MDYSSPPPACQTSSSWFGILGWRAGSSPFWIQIQIPINNEIWLSAPGHHQGGYSRYRVLPQPAPDLFGRARDSRCFYGVYSLGPFPPPVSLSLFTTICMKTLYQFFSIYIKTILNDFNMLSEQAFVIFVWNSLLWTDFLKNRFFVIISITYAVQNLEHFIDELIIVNTTFHNNFNYLLRCVHNHEHTDEMFTIVN